MDATKSHCGTATPEVGPPPLADLVTPEATRRMLTDRRDANRLRRNRDQPAFCGCVLATRVEPAPRGRRRRALTPGQEVNEVGLASSSAWPRGLATRSHPSALLN